jgi:hypothetical protein
MRYRLRTLLILAAILPPLLAIIVLPLARWWYLGWRPGHEAELEWNRGTGKSPPLIDHLGIIKLGDWLIPDWRERDREYWERKEREWRQRDGLPNSN